MVVLHVMPDLFPHGGTPRKLAGATGRLRKLGIQKAVPVYREANDGMVNRTATAGGCVLRSRRRPASDARLAAHCLGRVWRLWPVPLRAAKSGITARGSTWMSGFRKTSTSHANLPPGDTSC